jgi:hypothetical protein
MNQPGATFLTEFSRSAILMLTLGALHAVFLTLNIPSTLPCILAPSLAAHKWLTLFPSPHQLHILVRNRILPLQNSDCQIIICQACKRVKHFHGSDGCASSTPCCETLPTACNKA